MCQNVNYCYNCAENLWVVEGEEWPAVLRMQYSAAYSRTKRLVNLTGRGTAEATRKAEMYGWAGEKFG